MRKKPTGLTRPSIRVDRSLAQILGVSEGQKVAPVAVTSGLSRYFRDHQLTTDDPWLVEIDGPLSAVTGFPVGARRDRREIIKRLWGYIKAEGLQEASNPNHLDQAFDRAKREARRRGLDFSGWDTALLAGAIVLALVLLLHGRAPSGSQPLGTQPPPGGSKQPPG